MTEQKIIVSPRSYSDISVVANTTRQIAQSLGCLKDHRLNIPLFLAKLEIELEGQLIVHSVEPGEMPDSSHEGLTYQSGDIYFRDDVYDNAHDGDGRARFTFAHELGHWMMHRKEFAFARATGPLYKPTCPEWQANSYASFTLMDSVAIQHSNQCPRALSDLCQVSYRAAEVRLNINQQRGL